MYSTVFTFSGQGSQYFQMGLPLFEKNETFRRCMTHMDGIVEQLSGMSVLARLYDPGSSKGAIFDRLALSHPAIFMVEYSLAQALLQEGVQPELTLGASLGTFAAATVAGILRLEEALFAVVRQAELVEQLCKPGAMIAILGSPELCDEPFLRLHSELAAVNFDSHFVVSTTQHGRAGIEVELRRRGLTFQRLPVNFAFHSKWIDEAKEPLRDLGRSLARRSARIPMVCCESAQQLWHLEDDYLWNVVRGPIRFQQGIAALERTGAYRYIDMSPASTLTTLLRYCLRAESRSKAHGILSPFGGDMTSFDALAHIAEAN